MYNGPIAKGKDSMRNMLKRLDPVLREEFIAEKVKEERASHIIEDKGIFKVTVGENNDKEFKSVEEADQAVYDYFSKNPMESNYSDLEQ